MANKRIRRLEEHLEACGFRRDHEAQVAYDGKAWVHPNKPNDVIKTFPKMSDNSITALTKRAQKVADLSTSGDDAPLSIRERAQITRRKERTRRQREDEARRERAEAKEREIAERAALRSGEIEYYGNRQVAAEDSARIARLAQTLSPLDRETMAALAVAGDKSGLHRLLSDQVRDLAARTSLVESIISRARKVAA